MTNYLTARASMQFKNITIILCEDGCLFVKYTYNLALGVNYSAKVIKTLTDISTQTFYSRT